MEDWKKEKEVPYSYWQINTVVNFLHKIFGTKWAFIYLSPIVFVYCLILPKHRKASYDFLKHVSKYNSKVCPNFWHMYRHIYSFALSLLERVDVLGGGISIKNIDKRKLYDYSLLDDDMNNLRGVVLLCSHLGNIEFLHSTTLGDGEATGETVQKRKVNVILSKNSNPMFKGVLKKINDDVDLNLFDTDDFGIDTVCMLLDKLQKGEIVSIACDRLLSLERDREIEIDFLGGKVALPYGCFLLPVLFGVPVYHIFILRKDDKFDSTEYEFHVHKSKIDITVATKKNRDEIIKALALEYAALLEEKTIVYPRQWYNFYDFWK